MVWDDTPVSRQSSSAREMEGVVTLRQGLKPCGFFRLSSVRDRLRTTAWPRLGAYRSGGGKAQRRCIHPCIRLLGGARPVPCSMPHAKGCMAHSLRLASWEQATPASFDATPLGTYPRGGGFSWSLFFRAIARALRRGLATRAFAMANSRYSGETR